MNKPVILIVEDDPPVRNLMTTTLRTHDYRYLTAPNGETAILEAASHNPDIVLLDLGLPDMDGVEVIKRIRSWSNLPIIVISARSEDTDKIDALDAGADDYLVKPFSFDELLARLRVITRKHGGSATNVFTVADLTVDTASHHVARGGRTISLSAKEFALLEYMIRNRGVVLSRERIENHLWNYDYSGGSNVVDVYVSYLRRKIDADYPTKLIHTVWGVGWVLREEV